MQTGVCNIEDERLLFTGSDQSPPEYVVTQPFSFSPNGLSEACSAPCLCGPGGYSDNFDTGSYRYYISTYVMCLFKLIFSMTNKLICTHVWYSIPISTL